MKTLKIACEVHCRVDSSTVEITKEMKPKYQLYIDNYFLNERNVSWDIDNYFLREISVVELCQGSHFIKLRCLTPGYTFWIDKIEVDDRAIDFRKVTSDIFVFDLI